MGFLKAKISSFLLQASDRLQTSKLEAITHLIIYYRLGKKGPADISGWEWAGAEITVIIPINQQQQQQQ